MSTWQSFDPSVCAVWVAVGTRYLAHIERTEFLDQANENTLLGVMIEDKEGVDDVEAIAAVEGNRSVVCGAR